MSKTYRAWRIEETHLLPASVQDFVPRDHLARFVVSLVREQLDLSEVTGSYAGEMGQPPYHPVMMTALLLHGYCCGVYASRRLAKACEERADFMMIGVPPVLWTVKGLQILAVHGRSFRS